MYVIHPVDLGNPANPVETSLGLTVGSCSVLCGMFVAPLRVSGEEVHYVRTTK